MFRTKADPWFLKIRELDKPLQHADGAAQEKAEKDMMSSKQVSPFLTRSTVSFECLNEVEIDDTFTKLFYKSFLIFLRLPGVILTSFWLILKIPEK